MNPIRHFLCNTVIPPHSANVGTVNPLPIRRDSNGITSYWTPTPSEMTILQEGGCLGLTFCSGSMPPVMLQCYNPEGVTPEYLTHTDLAVEVMLLIDELRSGPAAALTFHDDNDEVGELPSCVVTCHGEWTRWEDLEVRDDSVLNCLRKARALKQTWEATQP